MAALKSWFRVWALLLVSGVSTVSFGYACDVTYYYWCQDDYNDLFAQEGRGMAGNQADCCMNAALDAASYAEQHCNTWHWCSNSSTCRVDGVEEWPFQCPAQYDPENP